jgi:hypothetical protein
MPLEAMRRTVTLIVAALAHADHDALEFLNTFAFAFFDLDMHADVSPGASWGIFSFGLASRALITSAIVFRPYV